MKIGAKRMRYPDNDPENGPAYMQQWTGTEWQCLHHKPEYDYEDTAVYCKNCGIRIMGMKEVKLITSKKRKV
jgi:DNA-directed RNA polymerase subunit RPC12/RpoP